MFSMLLPLLSLFINVSICAVTREDALKILQKPYSFVQGALVKTYVEILMNSDSPTPLPLKALVIDLSDLYSSGENIEFFQNEIMRLFRDHLTELNALELTSAFLQIDSLLDHVLHSNLMTQKRSTLQKSLLDARKEMLQLAKVYCNHYWAAIDIISYCSSIGIAQLKDIEAYPKLSEPIVPSILLNHVASLGNSIGIDSADSLSARLAIVALLFPRLTDPELEENERQVLITALLDSAFWMSHVRIGFCIAAMIRAGLTNEVELLAYNFQSRSWKSAAEFLPPKLKLTERLESLIRSTETTLLGELATSASVYLSRKALEHFGINWNLMNNDTLLSKAIKNNFPETQSLSSIFAIQEKLANFVTLIGLLYFKIEPGMTMEFLERFKEFSLHVFSGAPALTVFSSLKCPLNDKKLIPPGTCHFRRKLIPDAAKVMYIAGVMAARNYRLLTQYNLQKNLNLPESFDAKPFLSIKSSSEIRFFMEMTELIAHFNVNQHELVPVLEETGALAFLRDRDLDQLPDPIRCLLVEALIGMHLVAQVQVPKELLEIRGPYTLSVTAGRMRNIFKVVPLTEVLGFARGKLRELCMLNYKTFSVLLLAAVPMVMDGPSGHRYFMEFLTKNALVAHENLSPVISRIMAVVHEYSPTDYMYDLMIITAVLEQHVPLRANWAVSLSMSRKRGWVATYHEFAASSILADAAPFLSRRPFSDIEPSILLLNYAMGKNDFDMEKIAAATAALIFSAFHGEKTPECVPRVLSKAIFERRMNNHMPLYEIVVRVKFLLSGLLNLELCSDVLSERIIERISTEQVKFSEKMLKDYNAAFSHSKPKKKVLQSVLESYHSFNIVQQEEALPQKESTQSDLEKETSIAIETHEREFTNRPMANRRQPKSRKNPTRRGAGVVGDSFPASQTVPELSLAINSPAKLSSKSAPPMDTRISTSFSSKMINSEEDLEIKREQRSVKLTQGLIEKNLEFLSDGRLQLKVVLSEKFKQCLIQRIMDGTPFPFKLHEKSLLEVNKWMDKHVILPVWRPRVYRPVKIFLFAHPIEDIKLAYDIIIQLPELTLGRLQSLIYYSTRMKLRTIKIRVVPGQEPKVNNGWLEVPFWKEGKSLAEHVEQAVSLEANNTYKPKKSITRKDTSKKQTDQNNVEENSQQPSPGVKQDNENIVEKEQQEVDKLNVVENIVEKKEILAFKYTFTQTNDLLRLSDTFSFEALKNNITPNNFEKMFVELRTLMTSGTVEYVAFDCEMTGIYTKKDEALHNRGAKMSDDNLAKLHRGLKVHMIFQLGLVIKTRSNEWSAWNFYTCPTLIRESFTPGTFKFLFTDPMLKKNPRGNTAFLAEIKIEQIRSASIDPETQVKELVKMLIESQVPLVVYSGFVDILHFLKITGSEYDVAHEQVQEIISNPIFDVKEIGLGMNIPVLFPSLEQFAQALYEREFAKDMLHDASFDALLTAMVYEALILRNPGFVTAARGRLFKYKPSKQ